MLAAHGSEGTIAFVNSASAREQLVETLEETLRLQRKLIADARNPRVMPPELVAQVTVLERLDDRRDRLIAELRQEASADMRAYRRTPPIRELVLDALTEFRWPQNAKFVQEYLWAAQQLQVESRALAPLRRDEQRSWQRAPGAREAYIAPALHEDGTANPHWMTNSAWDLERRIVTSSQTERLLDLQKILTLTGRPWTGADRVRPRRATDTMLESYAKEVLDIDPLEPSATSAESRSWRLHVRDTASKLIGEIRSQDDPHRREIAERLAELSEDQRIWGRRPD
jgi:hypothetical protein